MIFLMARATDKEKVFALAPREFAILRPAFL